MTKSVDDPNRWPKHCSDVTCFVNQKKPFVFWGKILRKWAQMTTSCWYHFEEKTRNQKTTDISSKNQRERARTQIWWTGSMHPRGLAYNVSKSSPLLAGEKKLHFLLFRVLRLACLNTARIWKEISGSRPINTACSCQNHLVKTLAGGSLRATI